MRNIEIKAKIDDPDLMISRVVQLTKQNSIVKVMKQHDTFFKVGEGRLKLRKFQDDSGELIYYTRSDKFGPKLCTSNVVPLAKPACRHVGLMFSLSHGRLGIVEKTRKLYMIGQTRVHIDDVEGLGTFLELEVVLTDEQDIESGEKIAQDLMSKLGIKHEDLIANSYIDLLLNESTNESPNESTNESTNESKQL